MTTSKEIDVFDNTNQKMGLRKNPILEIPEELFAAYLIVFSQIYPPVADIMDTIDLFDSTFLVLQI